MSNAGFLLLSLQFMPGRTSRSFLCVSSFCFSARSTYSYQCRCRSQLHRIPVVRSCISFRGFSSKEFFDSFNYRNGYRNTDSKLLLPSENSNAICKTFFIMASLLTTTAVLGQAQVTSPKKMKTSHAESMDLDSTNKENEVRESVPVLKFVKMTPKAHTPTKGSAHAAGFDLKSAYDYTVPARGSCLVKTDIQIQLPRGTYGRVAPRSGLALKHKIDVGAGVIDEDYRGNVGVILFNHGDEDFPVAEGDRIAQLICEKIEYPDIVEVQDLQNSERGEAGFGSTGTKS